MMLLAMALLTPRRSMGGAQLYEPLSAQVQAGLAAAIAERAPPRHAFEFPSDAVHWLDEMSRRLERRIPDYRTRLDLLRTLHFEAVRSGLNPQLVLALIQVESNFRRYAVSIAGARGYMQVMPFWVGLIGRPDHNLFDPRTNLRYGCTILKHYMEIEKSNLVRALGRYNGSLGKNEYPNLVVRTWRSAWQYEEPPR